MTPRIHRHLAVLAATGSTVAAPDTSLLAPVDPSKVFAVGLNYRSHLGNAEPAKEPPIFLKLPTSITGHGQPIVLPEGSENVHYEAELVLVVGKRLKNATPEEAADAIFGVTRGTDVSGRNWQRADLQWFRAKASDTFGPVGPAVVTGVDPDDLTLRGRHNGEVVQGTDDRRSPLRLSGHRLLHQPLRNDRDRRRDLHRHPGSNCGAQAGRHVRGRARRHLPSQQPGRGRRLGHPAATHRRASPRNPPATRTTTRGALAWTARRSWLRRTRRPGYTTAPASGTKSRPPSGARMNNSPAKSRSRCRSN